MSQVWDVLKQTQNEETMSALIVEEREWITAWNRWNGSRELGQSGRKTEQDGSFGKNMKEKCHVM